MQFFISNLSALRFLMCNGLHNDRIIGHGNRPILSATRLQPKEDCTPDSRLLMQIGIPAGAGELPLHVNVINSADRSKSSLMTCHVWRGPSSGSYLRIDDHFFVQTPEALFQQLAGSLSLPHAVELADMLCGTYVPESMCSTELRTTNVPLTNLASLKRYCNRQSGAYGTGKALQALRYAVEGSASVMETRMHIVSVLPTRLGGRQLLPALSNHEMELSPRAQGLTWSSVRKPDLLWPEAKLALEYNGAEYHDSSLQQERDRQRMNALAAMGLKLIVARRYDVRSARALNALFDQVEETLCPKRRHSTAEPWRKQGALFAEVFGKDWWLEE